MKILSALLFSVLLLSCSSFKQSKHHLLPQNLDIMKIKKYPNVYKLHRPDGARFCKGELGLDEDYVFAGEELEDLIDDGMSCMIADFDGNGFVDVVLMSNGWQDDTTGQSKSEVLMILFDITGVMDIFEFPNKVSTFFVEFLPAYVDKGKYGEEIPRLPAVIERGKGKFFHVYHFKDGKIRLSKVPSDEA